MTKQNRTSIHTVLNQILAVTALALAAASVGACATDESPSEPDGSEARELAQEHVEEPRAPSPTFGQQPPSAQGSSSVTTTGLPAGVPAGFVHGQIVKTNAAIRGHYIVVFDDPPKNASVAIATTKLAAAEVTAKYGGAVNAVYERALHGFALEASASEAAAIARSPGVKYVVEDGEIRLESAQYGAPWGLIRIDQKTLPLDDNYGYDDRRGRGVHVYVLDTGIRIDHQEFGARASEDFTSINDGRGAADCHGHGTHVAGTVGGETFGVAKKVRLHSVRVLDCTGHGTLSGLIAGIDWVATNHLQPAVANVSITASTNLAVNDAVRSAIATGVTFVVAAGNESTDACTRSPASTTEAITVAASDQNDARASFSNVGNCVDLFAPGVDVLSASHASTTGSLFMSGTSMASPHVAGAAALVLDRFASLSPADLRNMLVQNATPNVISNSAGSPNLLAYISFASYGDRYLVGDWDGDGTSNLAVRRGNCVFMDTNFDGAHDILQCYGGGWTEDEYLVGDWDGDGRDNLAVRRGNCVLMDTNFDGVHDIEQCYGGGEGEEQYLVGDWDGDGRDNLAVRRGSCVLMDINFDWAHDIEQCYGGGKDEDGYLVGDWNGDGRDNLAVRRGSCVLMDTNFDWAHDIEQCYGGGSSEDDYLVGDWNGDHSDNLAVRRGSCALMDTNFDWAHDIEQCYGAGN